MDLLRSTLGEGLLLLTLLGLALNDEPLPLLDHSPYPSPLFFFTQSNPLLCCLPNFTLGACGRPLWRSVEIFFFAAKRWAMEPLGRKLFLLDGDLFTGRLMLLSDLVDVTEDDLLAFLVDLLGDRLRVLTLAQSP